MNEPNPARELSVQESVIFNNTKFSTEGMKQKHLHSFMFANRAFDIYIPVSHHNMSVEELKKSNGYHWASAAHFLLGTKAHGFPMWKQLQEQINSENEDIHCYLHMSKALRNKIFDGLDGVKLAYLDKDYDAFLMNDWVLIQLPFQPALLHLWLSVVLRKLYGFERDLMAPFYNYVLPPDIRYKIEKVYDLLSSTHENLAILFDYLQEQTKSDLEIFVQRNFLTLSPAVWRIVNFLNFVSNQDKLTAVRYMADEVFKAWNPVFHDGTEPFKRLKMALDNRCYAHNLSFWTQPPGDLKIFGHSKEDVKHPEIAPDNSVFQQITTNNFNRRVLDVFTSENFKKSEIKIFTENVDSFEKIINKINYYSNWERSLASIVKRDRGLLTDTLYAAAATELSKATHDTIKYICETCDEPMSQICRDQIKCNDFHKLSRAEIIDAFEVESSKWSFNNCLHKLKEKIGEPNNTCPDYTEEPRAIALQFEARIRRIVFDAISPNYNMFDFEMVKDEVFKDWHVVQYLLPCFVVSFLDLCESSTPATKEQKEWYLRFIHELISTYETDGIRKSSMLNISKDLRDNIELVDLIDDSGNEKMLDDMKRISRSFSAKLEGDNDAFIHLKERCLNFKVFIEVLLLRKKPNPPADLAKKPSVYWNWLMWDFFNRMDVALKRSDRLDSGKDMSD